MHLIEKVYAQSVVGIDGGITVTGPKGMTLSSVGNIINTAVPYIFGIAGVGLLLMIISAGFSLMTSAGDAKKMEQGKTQLTFAIVGFIIIFSAFWIVQFAGFAFGIKDIQTIFK